MCNTGLNIMITIISESRCSFGDTHIVVVVLLSPTSSFADSDDGRSRGKAVEGRGGRGGACDGGT